MPSGRSEDDFEAWWAEFKRSRPRSDDPLIEEMANDKGFMRSLRRLP